MIYEEFKPFLLAACFPCDQHHNNCIESVSNMKKMFEFRWCSLSIPKENIDLHTCHLISFFTHLSRKKMMMRVINHAKRSFKFKAAFLQKCFLSPHIS